MKKIQKLNEGAKEAENNSSAEQLPLPDTTTAPALSPVETTDNTTVAQDMEPSCHDYGSTSESPETTELEDDRTTRHEQTIASTPLRQATTSSLEWKGRGGEADMGEIVPPKQNQSETAKSVAKSIDVPVSPRSGHANGSAGTDSNHKLGKRKHQDIPPSLLEGEGPSQVKKARNHVSKIVSLSRVAGPAPKKVQKPRKKPRSIIPRGLRRKPNNTVRSHSHSNAKSDTSAYDRKRSIESSAHQCHSKDLSTHNINASSEAYTLTNPSPHKLRGISPEIPLQSDSSSQSLTGKSDHVSSDVESNSKPSRRLYDSEESSQTTDEQSESYSEDDWEPARVKKKKFMRHKTMKAAGLIIDDILKIRKQSSRTVLYDCIGSPKTKKGSHSPKRRLSLITRDTPKSERWAGPSARKPVTLAPSFLGSPATLLARSERTERSNTNLMQVTSGGGNEKHDAHVVHKAVLPSTDLSTEADEQDDGSAGEVSKDSDNEKTSKVTWLKKLPKRRLTVELDRESRLEGNHSGDESPKPKPLLEVKSSEAGPVEDTREKQRMLGQLSDEGGEMLVDPLVCTALNGSDKDKDEQSSNKAAKISSKQNTIPSSEEDLEDAIVDVLGIDPVDEENTNVPDGARANERQKFTRIRLTDADFTVGEDSRLEGNTLMSSEDDETEEDSSKQQNGRLSDDDTQEPIDVLGLDDAATTSSNTEGEWSSENDQVKPLFNVAQKLKPKHTVIRLTDEDLTTEGSLLQEEGDWRREDGALRNIEDTGDDDDDDDSNGDGSSTEEPAGGEEHNSQQQTSRKLTDKAIHDIMKASSHCSVQLDTVVSIGGNRSWRLKRPVTKQNEFVDQSNLQDFQVVLDTVPVPVGKTAVVDDSNKLITKDKKKGTKKKKKLKAGAASGDVISRDVQTGAEGKVAKRKKSGQDSKRSKGKKKIAKLMEDDSNDIVVKDLVEDNNSEDYRVKLKLISKQKPQEEKKLSTKPMPFIPLSGPMGIASSAEDDDAATNNGKTGQKLRTVEQMSNLNATDKEPTVKTVVQEGEGSGMEIDTLLAAISEGSGGMEVDSLQAVISDGHVSEKAIQAEADIMIRLSQNHHRKTVGETSSLSTVPVAKSTTFQSHGREEHNYSQADPTATTVLSKNQEEHRSKTTSEASLDALLTSPVNHSPLRSLEEHSYSRTAPTLTAASLDVPQNQTEHHSKTSPSTACTLPSQNIQSKTIGEASSESIGTGTTTDQPHTCSVEERSDKSSTAATVSGLSHDELSKTVSSKFTETESTTDQPRSMEVEHSDGNSAAAIVHGPSQNHQSQAELVDSITQLTAALVSHYQKSLLSKTNPILSSLSQNLQARDSKTVGEASSKSTATTTTTDSTSQESQDQANSKSALAYPITAALLSQDQPRSEPAEANPPPTATLPQAEAKSAVANPTSTPFLAQNLIDIHRKTLGTSTSSTAVTAGKDTGSNDSSSRNTTGNSSSVVGGASVTMATLSTTTMTTSRLTSIAEDSSTGESTLQPKKKKRRTKLLDRTKASSGFQLSVVEDKKVGVICANAR